jgi:hypothetical protein
MKSVCGLQEVMETLASQKSNRFRTFQTAQQGEYKLLEHDG